MSEQYFLTSQRLGFRAWNLGDIDAATAIWSDPADATFMGGPLTVPKIHSRLVTENRLLRIYNVQQWPLFTLDKNEFVGCCGLRPYKPSEKIFELSVHIRRSMRGKGLASEAAHAIIDYAFNELGATAIFATHHPDDHVAKKLLEHIGFQYVQEEHSTMSDMDQPAYTLEKMYYCSLCLR